MDTFFKFWPSLETYAKLFPSKRFPGLFYYDYDSQCASQSAKPVLILIHGLGDEADTWRHLIPLLGAAGYRVLAPDLPGFGRSPVSRYSSLGRHRDAVLELAEAVSDADGGQGVVLIGSSMGAAAAEAAVLVSADDKSRRKNRSTNRKSAAIRALVLLDGCIPAKHPGSAQALLTALPFTGKKWYRSFRNDPERAWKSLTSYYADINCLPDADKEFLRGRVMDRVMSLSQERGYFSSLRSMIFQSLRPSYYRRIGNWPGKIALIWGKEDAMLPHSAAETFIKLRGKNTTTLTLISGAGHLPHQEKPAETANAILAFLQELGP
jgi:pimeloyl-ACP methyl ester carboxylesterase